MKNRCEDSPSLYPAYTTKGVFFVLFWHFGIGGSPNFICVFLRLAIRRQMSEV